MCGHIQHGSLLGLIVWIAVLSAGLTACGQSETPAASQTDTPATTAEPLNVTVSILPQKYFVERVGGEHVQVNVMVQPGESPATYEPKPEQLQALSQTVAYFRIGVPFENAWMDRITAANTDMRIVDTTAGIQRRGTPERPDPHIWLSPRLVKIQAETIAQALSELDPDREATYQANLQAFISDIEALDGEIQTTLAQVTSRKFMVFHPAWGYFADDYDLEMIPVEVGGQEPGAAELADLIRRAQAEDIHVIFAQPEFSTRSAETIAKEIDGEVLLISPLAPDWLANMRRVAQVFASVLSAKG